MLCIKHGRSTRLDTTTVWENKHIYNNVNSYDLVSALGNSGADNVAELRFKWSSTHKETINIVLFSQVLTVGSTHRTFKKYINRN